MSGRAILIAEADACLAHLLAHNLREAGSRIILAKNGVQACELAEAEHPDLIISAYRMPILDGLSACARLKQNTLTSQIPVLMLTARGHCISAADLAMTNIRAVLPKPFSSRELMLRIEDLIGPLADQGSPASASAAYLGAITS